MNKSKHYPTHRVLASTTTMAAILGKTALTMANECISENRRAADDGMEMEAAAFNSFGKLCLADVHEAIVTSKNHSENHRHGVDCIPDDCNITKHSRNLKALEEDGDRIDEELYQLQVSISSRTRHSPLNHMEVMDTMSMVQMELRLDQAKKNAAAASNTQNMSAEERHAHAVALEGLVMRGTHRGHNNDCPEHGEEKPRSHEDQERQRQLQKRAQNAEEELDRIAEPVLNKAAEAMVTDMSPSLSDSPDAWEWYDQSAKWLGLAEPGIYMSNAGRKKLEELERTAKETIGEDEGTPRLGDPIHLSPEDGETAGMLLSFVHGGRRIIKDLNDPYPKGYPMGQAQFHIHQAEELIEQLSEQRVIPGPAALMFQGNIETAALRLELDLYSVSSEDLSQVVRTARDAGATPGLTATLVETLTGQSHSVADAIIGTQWRKQATTQQAKALLHAAKNVGLDQESQRRIAHAIGHTAAEMELGEEKLPPDAMERICTEAEKAGIPSENIENAKRWLTA